MNTLNQDERNELASEVIEKLAKDLFQQPDSVEWIVIKPIHAKFRNKKIRSRYMTLILLMYAILVMSATLKSVYESGDDITFYAILLIALLLILFKLLSEHWRYGNSRIVSDIMVSTHTLDFIHNTVCIREPWMLKYQHYEHAYCYTFRERHFVPLPPLPQNPTPTDQKNLAYIQQEIERRSRFQAKLYEEIDIKIPWHWTDLFK